MFILSVSPSVNPSISPLASTRIPLPMAPAAPSETPPPTETAPVTASEAAVPALDKARRFYPANGITIDLNTGDKIYPPDLGKNLGPNGARFSEFGQGVEETKRLFFAMQEAKKILLRVAETGTVTRKELAELSFQLRIAGLDIAPLETLIIPDNTLLKKVDGANYLFTVLAKLL